MIDLRECMIVEKSFTNAEILEENISLKKNNNYMALIIISLSVIVLGISILNTYGNERKSKSTN
jgi:hypothetical protein